MDTRIMMPSGRLIDPLHLRPEDVCIEDIAARLSKICRFGGSTRPFYSVARHSVLVSCVVPFNDRMYGLLHDAAEAYLWDCAKPYKHLVEIAGKSFVEVEGEVRDAIIEGLGLAGMDPHTIPLSVHEADSRMLATEARDLMPDHEVWNSRSYGRPYIRPALKPWGSPEDHEKIFLEKFEELSARKGLDKG